VQHKQWRYAVTYIHTLLLLPTEPITVRPLYDKRVYKQRQQQQQLLHESYGLPLLTMRLPTSRLPLHSIFRIWIKRISDTALKGYRRSKPLSALLTL
jgi:hypothetical protein